MSIGNKIRDARKKAGLTQKELGERLGISYQTIAQWENNLRNPKFTTLQKIADALHVDVSVFLPKEFIDSLSLGPEDELFVGPDNGFYSRPRRTDKPPISDEDIKFALFGGKGEITDDMLDEVRTFAEFVRQREEAKKKPPQD